MDLGPVSVFISWQSAIDSVAIVSVVGVIKRFMEAAVGGKEVRKKNRWLTAVLTALPIVMGALMAIVVPLRPGWLESYARLKGSHPYYIYGAWGICVGQFSDYTYQHISKLFRSTSNTNIEQSLSVTPPP